MTRGGDTARSRRAAPPGPGAAGTTTADLPSIPADVAHLLGRIWASGHSAYIVGGSLRDALLGRVPADWDLTTGATPRQIQAIFPGSVYENRFGTVVVRHRGVAYEITTFRADASYSDHRHPDEVTFGHSVEDDLARRDFTVNAMAWGGQTAETAAYVDPFGGRADLDAHLLRAVGDPDRRFAEDALRMIRCVRLAAALEFAVDRAALDAVSRNAGLAASLSGERIGAELGKLLAAPRPSTGLRLMESTGLLAVVAPDLAAQRGVPQNKLAGEDLWDHTLRTVDAAPNRPLVRLAALLHDVGKPSTLADGHFIGHETVGAEIARRFLAGVRRPRHESEQVVNLVAQHMFTYEPAWSDAAVRRFIRRVGPAAVDDLLALREADNQGSGLEPGAGGIEELRSRIRVEIEAGFALSRDQLAVDGNDLMAELDLPRGPVLGMVLDELTERVIAEPALNDRARLLELARHSISIRRMSDNRG